VLQIILEECDSPHDVKTAIRGLPSDLEAIYSRCLTRKRKNRRSSDTNLLIWVCAAPNPLDINSLRELLAMNLETGHLSPDKMPAEELLLQSGGGLVTLDIAEQLVLPVHSTARKFVFSELARESMSASAASNESWPLHIEAGRWSEATFRSALGSLCLFHIKQKTTRDLAPSSKPTKMRVPQAEIPKIFRRVIPAQFDTKAADVSIKSSPFRLNSKQASVTHFLKYAIENWLLCNKSLASDDENLPWMRRPLPNTGIQPSTELFETIAKERNDSFGVHPWPCVPGSSNSHLSHMFAYAVANDHIPLLRVVKRNHRSLPKQAFDLPLALHVQIPAVHVAAKKGFHAVLSELADICNLNAVCLLTGKRALHFAAEAGSVGCLEVLMQDRRLDLSARDKKGRTPLFAAALAGQSEMINVLYENGGVDVDVKDKNGLTPLWWASTNGHHKVVEVLLDTRKVDIEVQDDCGRSPLSQAAANGYEKVVRLLLEMGGAKVDVNDKYGFTPLSRAAMSGHSNNVEVLLRIGKANVHARDLEGWNALFHAANDGHEKVVEVLLATGQAEIDARDRCGATPLWRAVEEGRLGVVEVLLGTGKVDLDVRDYGDTSMLSLTVKKGHYKVEQRLREAMEARGDIRASHPTPDC
jgi:ankyrin repeat protein